MASSNSESRKRNQAMSEAEATMVARCNERRREVLQQALAEVWSGASFEDADCVMDQLSDRGARLVVGPHG